jgi:hypothetical protein
VASYYKILQSVNDIEYLVAVLNDHFEMNQLLVSRFWFVAFSDPLQILLVTSVGGVEGDRIFAVSQNCVWYSI